MAKAITNTTQLDFFLTIRNILKGNADIARLFKDNNFYEFEPNMDSISFDMLPYFVISVPNFKTDLLVADHSTTLKDIDVTITMVFGWEYRSKLASDGSKEDAGKFRQFCNAVIRQIESSESTLEAVGFQNPAIDLIDTGNDIIQGKQALRAIFTLSGEGYVWR